MDKNSKVAVGVVVVILLVAGGFALLRNQAGVSSGNKENKTTDQNNDKSNGDKQSANILTGVLKKSDNMKNGNLMLMMPGHIYYLNTGRDFSKFMDQEVNMEIDGTLDSFRLVDIQAK